MIKTAENAPFGYHNNGMPRKTNRKWGINTYTAEKRKISWMKYSKTSKGIYANLKSSCVRKKNSRLVISRKDFIEWYDSQEKKCCYCNITQSDWIKGKDKRHKWYKRLTIDRIDNNKGYEVGNIALCCQLCNSIKNDFFSHSEMIKIGQIIKNKLNKLYV